MKLLERKAYILTWICYITSIVLWIYALFSFINIHQYIQSMVSANQLVISQQFFKVCMTYVDNVLPHLAKAVSLLAVGYLVQMKVDQPVEEPAPSKRQVKAKPQEKEEDIDTYLHSLKEKK